ncbi:MAG TPA: Na+:solute symporter [Candidatus Krumholzibacteria bacterium]|nr:Na+:solute symporter [Candidatus Krumholzibacteria bacterium]HRX51484.1 Na+:solute symporter [Candidatus Krumholzibacteria bacterium]
MTVLHPLDWAVVAVYVIGTVALGLAFRRRASRSAESYFLAGRSLPWWVLGTSMVATTFAADTPLAVTGFVREHGIWYNWFGWHYVLAQILAVFLFSRFWRRAGVITDNELIEMRYSGRPAAALRAFKAAYFSILYNLIVMGWVLAGLGTVAETVLGVPRTTAIPVGAALALSYALLSGFWGVVITDVLQFGLAMFGAVALAASAVGKVGGLAELKARVAALPQAAEITAMIPGGDLTLDSSLVQFLIFITIMWWASHNADGGGYLIQRMAAARDERHARAATLWFAVANNAVRYWPWILTALASLVLVPAVPEGASQESAYPILMRQVLGPGLLGVMLVSFFAAFMSTIDTHLNWGASYLVNDLYRRFWRRGAGDRETVLVSKVCVATLLAAAVLVALALTSIGKAWLFVWAMGAGIGPVLILRWFWWRINAWSEIAALASSVVVAVGFEVAAAVQAGPEYRLFSTPLTVGGFALATHHKALILVPVSVISWVTITFLTRPADPARLREFVTRVRPGGWWGPVAASLPDLRHDGLGRRTLGLWAAGVALVYGLTFGIGQLLIGSPLKGALLLAAAAAGAVVTARELRRS